jgi:hypothetical protein
MYLAVQFGGKPVQVNQTNLKELTIIQDINKFLPEFRLRISDNSGEYTHIVPSDKHWGKVYIELALDENDQTTKNAFNFLVYSRTPTGDYPNPSAVFDIDGLLDVDGLFNKDESRGFSGSISSTINSIALNDLENIDSLNISTSLSTIKKLVQPTWTNAQFLKYLKENVIGINGEYDFKCFVSTYKYKNTFNFKGISEMIKNKASYKFVLSGFQSQDQYPIFNYYIYDSYKLYGTFAEKEQGYSYFNYDTSTFVKGSEKIADYASLADYYLIDKSDDTGNNSINNTGRSNDFTSDFKGYVKGNYGDRINSLVKMWITTQGLANIIPGQVVQVFFPQDATSIYDYQYSGDWLIERVVHNVGGSIFLTKLLLTRSGVSTDKSTTLLSTTIKV